MTIFINGKQKRVKRPGTVDGIPADEFIRNNADPLWLFRNGMYEEQYQWEQVRLVKPGSGENAVLAPCLHLKQGMVRK